MATHCSILAWRVSWTEEPSRLQSTGSQRVRHNRVTNRVKRAGLKLNIKNKTKQNKKLRSWHPVPFSSVQFSLVHFSSFAQSCLTLCDPMNCSTPGLPVYHQLPEFTQTHIHRVSDTFPAISSSVISFSSCAQSLPASESFPMSQHLA